MPCSGRYAEADQFATLMCVGTILSRVDDSGAVLPGNAFLTDSTVDFIALGVQAGVGMVLYNTTRNTSGVVTAATATTLTAPGTVWVSGDGYRIVLIDALERAAIESYLNIAAADIHASRAASGGCNCTLASWAADYLAKLNIIDAAVIHNCTCGGVKMSDEARANWLQWVDAQLELIRLGKLELCEGETGSEFPAWGSIEQSLTEWNQAQIIVNTTMRNP